MDDERESLSWQAFGQASRELAQAIADDGPTLDMPVMLPPVPSAVDFSAKKVLIADDVADSGRTIELVYTFIKDHVEDVRSAVIYEKPRSLIRCDYVWKHTDRWINFPWSSMAPVVQRAGQVFDA